MFNVLSGLQEGSHSVVINQRSGPAGLVKGAVVATSGTANTIAKADALVHGGFAEFVFEDLAGQSSGKYTVISGKFEAETDQVAGTPAIGNYLKVGTGADAGKLAVEATAGTPTLGTVARVVDSYSMTDDAKGTTVTVYRIATV